MKGRDAVIRLFMAEGVKYVFGNPGTTEFGLLTSLKECPEISYILALQEGCALGMAHTYANASGKTGVVNLHVAPGLGNAMGALYNAFKGKMPLMITAGQQDTRFLVQEPILSHDLVAMAKPLTKWAVQIQHADDIPLILSRAFKIAQDPPKGPVFVSLPGDVMEEEVAVDLPGPNRYYRSMAPAPPGINAAAKLLVRSKHPVIICGDGIAASRAQDELVAVAELLGANVWHTMMMGAMNFPTSHDQFRGILPGEAGATRLMLGETDVVLAVGANLFEDVFYSPELHFPAHCSIIQVDDSPWQMGKNYPPAIGILADPKSALQALFKALLSKMPDDFIAEAGARREEQARQKKLENQQIEAQYQKRSGNIPIAPVKLMKDLGACLPDNAVIYNEAITAYLDLICAIPFDRPDSLFGNHGGGIGQGLPGAIGVKLAHPDKPVIAVVGDGSAMYSIQSLWTAAHYQIPVVYIILSNRSYRILKYNMNRYLTVEKAESAMPYAFMDFVEPKLDFVGLAQSMGLKARLIEHPKDIRPAIEESLALNKPCVLEIVTEGKGPGE